jgi:hypothetical protein
MGLSNALIVTLSLAFCFSLKAAPALNSSQCRVRGIVESIHTRSHKYEPESWRKEWGLPKERIYVDIKLSLNDVSSAEVLGGSDCSLEHLQDKIFQLKSNQDQALITTGQCITALTQYSGDEFALGQWLWDIEPCQP